MKLPLWLFNVLVTPLLPIRVVALTILIVLTKLGEWAYSAIDFCIVYLPCWKMSPAFARRRMEKLHPKRMMNQIAEGFNHEASGDHWKD